MMVANKMSPAGLKLQEHLSMTTGVCVCSPLFACVCVCVMAGQLRGTFEILRLKGKKAAITGFASKKPRVVY